MSVSGISENLYLHLLGWWTTELSGRNSGKKHGELATEFRQLSTQCVERLEVAASMTLVLNNLEHISDFCLSLRDC